LESNSSLYCIGISAQNAAAGGENSGKFNMAIVNDYFIQKKELTIYEKREQSNA